jgi:hypothetical protein
MPAWKTLRVYSQPTDDDKHNALRHLTVDRKPTRSLP